MNRTEVANNLFDSIDIIIDRKIAKLELDRTIPMKIVAINSYDNSYTAEYQGARHIVYPIGTDAYKENNTVWVLVPQNKFSNDKFILGPISAERALKK